MLGSLLSLLLTGSSALSNLSISNCAFESVNNYGFGIYTELDDSSALSNLSISSCTFGAVIADPSISSYGISTALFDSSALSVLSVSDCSFGDISINNIAGAGIDYFGTSSASNSLLQMSNNTFVDSSSSFDGYATIVFVTDGTVCLTFTDNNTESASGGVDPYSFEQVDPSVFNIQSTRGNTGAIQYSGSFGTCNTEEAPPSESRALRHGSPLAPNR